MTPADASLLARLASACAENLASDEDATAYLREQGIVDERVWSAYRLGIGGDAIIAGCDEAERERMVALGLLATRGRHPNVLARRGCVLPSFDPREPERPVGIIQVSRTQNACRFVTPPAGVGCALDVGDHPRLVLCDHALIALRMVQAGIPGVLIVPDATTLAPLHRWLAERELLVASATQVGLDDLAAGLGSLRAERVSLGGQLKNRPAASLALRGLADAATLAEPAAPLTPAMLQGVWRYARHRLKAGQGRELLARLGVPADLVDPYDLGYLPAGWPSVLDRDTHQALAGLDVAAADVLLVPAVDEAGAVVDWLAVDADDGGPRVRPLHREPQGLLGARIAAAHGEATVVVTFGDLLRRWRIDGDRVLWLRDAADARHNADRLHAAGIRRVSIVGGDPEMVGVLRAAGIAVADHAAPSTASDPHAPELVEHDPVADLAVWRLGTATYTTDVPWDGGARLEVTLRHDGQAHRDRFDLAVAAQRRRFAANAAARTGLDAEIIDADLVRLLDAVRRLREPEGPAPACASQGVDADDATLAALRGPHLLDRIAADLTVLGWVGEDRAKRLAYLAALSRKLDEPVWTALAAPGGVGLHPGLPLLAACTPPEDLVHCSRLTDAALYHHDRDALRHRLLVVDAAEALTGEVVTALRVLHARGALSQVQVQRAAVGTAARSHLVDVRGPLAVLAATAARFDRHLRLHCLELHADESPEQTALVLAEQRRRHGRRDPQGDAATRATILQRHHAWQRGLPARPVAIPFAERIDFPVCGLAARPAQARFLGLVAASALLHQHQRGSEDGCVVAAEADFDLIAELLAEEIAALAGGLDERAEALWVAILEAGLEAVTMPELAELLPDWNRHAFRTALDDLLAAGRLRSPGGGRGRRARIYRVVPDAEAERPAVRLLPADAPELATIGGTGFANLSPDRITA